MTALKYICSALKTTYSILSNNVNVNFFKPKLQKCSTKVAIALVSNLAKLNKNEVFIGLSVFYYLGWLFFIYTKKNIFIQKKHFVYTTLLILINNTSKIFNKITVNNEKKVNLSKFFKVREATIAVAVMFKSSLNYFWPTRYKFNIDFKSILPNTVRTFFKVYFLRKNKIFNKNRYARNRQSCRVIVY